MTAWQWIKWFLIRVFGGDLCIDGEPHCIHYRDAYDTCCKCGWW